ncbi:NUDIX domain-containing protein [Zooshikella harenae]|uniref:NUDIX hydrolase n=1 Tax=Zooshikella harenae TaxID=2827238 RepID=A0ABS5ZGP8_9GAMM|nr:NUDIX hydrolase [Zooshikella harenae]MBU2713174.1 NUDIX hydrolase [Zooshikella harenae]
MAVWAIIENKNEILLIKRSESTSISGQWCFPGGGIKHAESPESACVREAKEEVGLNIEILEFLMEYEGEYFYKCCIVDNDHEITLKLNECDSYSWVQPKYILSLGIIMDLKKVYMVLNSMGYQIELNDEARNIIS